MKYSMMTYTMARQGQMEAIVCRTVQGRATRLSERSKGAGNLDQVLVTS
jgi:hypothetical protein